MLPHGHEGEANLSIVVKSMGTKLHSNRLLTISYHNSSQTGSEFRLRLTSHV